MAQMETLQVMDDTTTVCAALEEYLSRLASCYFVY